MKSVLSGSFFLRVLAVVTAVVLSGAVTVSAQETTGKIEGVVRDPNQQPVMGAQVLIPGTSFSAATNSSGYFFINNVPAGTYSVRAQFIGLQPLELQNVRVRAGETVTVPFELRDAAVVITAIRVEAAATPIVPRDQVTSRSAVSGAEVDQLPINDPNQIVTLQPGVTSIRGGAISIRGGRANEQAVFIDGAPVRNNRTAGTNVNIATNAVEEVAVTTGALGAEFGDAQSGVVSVLTRSGGPSYAGSFTYESDEPFGNDMSVGLNRFEGSLSGPVVGNLTFFVGGTLQGQNSPFFGKGFDDIPSYALGGVADRVTVPRGLTDSAQVALPLFVQYGGECEAENNRDALGNSVDCQGGRLPGAWNSAGRLSGKLQYTYGSGSRISASAHLDRDQQFGLIPGGAGTGLDPFQTESTGGQRIESGLYVLNWVQQVFRGSTSELAFDVNLSYQKDRVVSGQLERDWDLDNRDPFMGINIASMPFTIDFDHFSNDTGADAVTSLDSQDDWDQLIRNVRTNSGTRRPFQGRLGLIRNPLPRMNPWAVTNAGFNNAGVSWGSQLSFEERYTARANVDWQADRYNRFKFGGEFRTARTNHFAVGNQGLTSAGFGSVYSADPVLGAAYAQDRLDLGDVVVEFGLRWDYFDSRALFPRVPGRIFTHPDFDPSNPVSDEVWKEAESHTAWSPRLRASFPITDKTGFRLSYSHQVQAPNFANLYLGTNNDLANTNTNDLFGGDVDFAKTILFEFGVRHAFSPDMVLDVSAYNKDKLSDHTYRILPFFDPFTQRVNNVNVLTNADFGNVRGVDVQLQRRFSNIFSGQVSYTFQNSKNTGSDPTDFLFGLSRQPAGVTGVRPEPPQATLRTRDDRRHSFTGSWSLTFPADYRLGILRDVGVFGTFRFLSGLPYTRLQNTGTGNTSFGALGLVANTVEPLQASETPWTKFFDVRVTKGFSVGGTGVTLYADARNVFNFTNRLGVYSETGDIENEEFFRVSFLDPQTQTLRLESQASGFGTQVTGANGELIEAVNLNNDCSLWQGSGGAPSCHMLRQAEARFGNGDGVYDVTEQEAAVRSLFNLTSGEHFFLGAPRHVRLGVQLDF